MFKAIRRLHFNLKALVCATTILAVVVVVIQDYKKLTEAREAFEYAMAMRHLGRIRVLDVLSASRQQYDRESAAVWISREQAKWNHVRRLKMIVKDEEARQPLRGSPDVQERVGAEIEQV